MSKVYSLRDKDRCSFISLRYI